MGVFPVLVVHVGRAQKRRVAVANQIPSSREVHCFHRDYYLFSFSDILTNIIIKKYIVGILVVEDIDL